jgi:hypothetical protein
VPSCPYCGIDAHDTDAEIAHMETMHPEIVRERLKAAGVYEEAKQSYLGVGRTLRLVPKDGEGSVVIHLPMDGETVAGLLKACSKLGLDFDHIVRSGG